MKHGNALRRGLALVLSAAMAVSTAFAANLESVSLVKSASPLENDKTRVSLAIGSSESVVESNVVFVLDKSTSTDVRNEANAMLDELLRQVNAENTINVAVVTFEKTVTVTQDWIQLTADSIDGIKTAIETKKSESGTNIQLGLEMGRKLLDERKDGNNHLVLVTDGITYQWGDGMTIYSESASNGEESINAGNDMMESHHEDTTSYFEKFEDIKTWYDTYGDSIHKDIEEFGHPYGVGQYKADVSGQTTNSTYKNSNFEEGDYIPAESLKEHFSANDAAVYMAVTEWENIVNAGYNAYAYADASADNASNAAAYPWASNFVSSLYTVGGKSGKITDSNVDGIFDNVKNSVLYEIESGTVYDTIGHNFDWVGMDNVTLTVGDKKDMIGNVSGNTISFDGGNYVVTYSVNGIGEEVIKWEINVPVRHGEDIILSYDLTIVDKTPGTYPTNENAYLEYDSTDGTGGKEEFNKPVITIEDDGGSTTDPGETPDPGDDNDKPSGGGDNDRYEGPDLTVVKVDEDGETIESNARFRIYKEQGSKTMWYKGNQSWSEDEEDAWIFNTSVGDGSFTAYDLKPGTYYIVEISAPEGYDLAEEPLEVEVESRDVTVEFVNSGDGVVTTPTKPVPDTGR